MHAPLALLSRVAPLAVVTALLAGCGPGKNEFAPPCPRPSFVQGLSDLTRYRPNSSGQDLTEMLIQGRLVSLKGECKLADKKSLLVEVTVTMQAEFLRGPAMPAGSADVPVFLAVTDGDTVLDKQIFPVRVTFPPNVDRVVMTSPEVMMVLPTTAEKSPAAFGIVAGFQLTTDELAASRHRASR
jgi:hypothetical protein